MQATKPTPAVTQRRAQRDLVDFTASAVSRSGVHDVKIVNVSPLGLMGRTSGGVTAGDSLLFELPQVGRIESIIRWVEDGRVGVEFLTPIEAARYAMMLAFMPQRQTQW